MAPKKGGKKKNPAPAPAAVKAQKEAKKSKASTKNRLIEVRPKKFGIGKDKPPKRDMSRLVQWPKYVRLQRQRRILLDRLSVPPSVHQFTRALDKHTAAQLFQLADKYRPEDKKEKKQRLKAVAAAKASGKDAGATSKPVVLKYGFNHVTTLIEQKKAKLVLIAHDVDPLEIVLWMPSLCRKMGVPYCIVKSKSRLGQLVHKKTASCVAFTGVKKEDANTFAQLTEVIKEQYNDRYDALRRRWGGGALGAKSRAALAKKAKAIAAEEAARAGTR